MLTKRPDVAWPCRYTCAAGEVYSCSGSDHIVAGGTDGSVWFWDRRNQKVLQKFEDSHMDMVTVCRFHAHRPSVFFSGSDDGLVAAFEFSKGVNEDDAFLVRAQVPKCCHLLHKTCTSTPGI